MRFIGGYNLFDKCLMLSTVFILVIIEDEIDKKIKIEK
jgi:hypothetical protein